MYYLKRSFYAILFLIPMFNMVLTCDLDRKVYEIIQNNGAKIETATSFQDKDYLIEDDIKQKIVCRMNNGESSSSINWYYPIVTGKNKTSRTVFENVFEGLLSSEGDNNNYPCSACAELLYYDSKTLTWTIKLKEGLKWSDGSKLTAHDFVRFLRCKFNSKYYPNQKIDQRVKNILLIHGPLIKNSKKILDGEMDLEDLGVWAENDYCLKLQYECSNPLNETLYQFVRFYPLHKNYISLLDNNIENKDLNNLSCNGPFKLGNIKDNEYITILKNDYYWDSRNVKLKEIKILLNEDNSYINTYEDWKVGKIDILNVNEGLASIINDDHIRYVGVYPCTKITAFFANCYRKNDKEDVFWNNRAGDKRVRKALNILLDRDLLFNSLKLPEKETVYGFLNTSIPEAIPVTPTWDNLSVSGKKHLVSNILNSIGHKKFNPLQLKVISYNANENPILQVASKLFTAATSSRYFELSEKNYSNSEMCIQDAQKLQGYYETVDFYFFEMDSLPGIVGAYSNYRMLFSDKKEYINDFLYFNREFNEILLDIKNFNELEKFYKLEKILIEESPIIPINMKNQYYLIGEFIGNWSKTKNNLPLEGNLYFKRLYKKKPKGVNE